MTAAVAVTLDSGEVVAAVVGGAAFLAAVAYLVRIVRRILRWARAMHRLVDRELTHNHGTSIKDDVYGIAVSVGKLSRQVDDMHRDLYQHLAERGRNTP